MLSAFRHLVHPAIRCCCHPIRAHWHVARVHNLRDELGLQHRTMALRIKDPEDPVAHVCPCIYICRVCIVVPIPHGFAADKINLMVQVRVVDVVHGDVLQRIPTAQRRNH